MAVKEAAGAKFISYRVYPDQEIALERMRTELGFRSVSEALRVMSRIGAKKFEVWPTEEEVEQYLLNKAQMELEAA